MTALPPHVEEAVQKLVDHARSRGAHLIVTFSHLPIDEGVFAGRIGTISYGLNDVTYRADGKVHKLTSHDVAGHGTDNIRVATGDSNMRPAVGPRG